MATCLSFWKNKKYFQNLIMRRDICNWQVNEASLVRAQMWSGICYTKPWQVKQVVSCPLKQLRTPPALLWAQRPQCDSWKRSKMNMTVAPSPAMLPLQLARKSGERETLSQLVSQFIELNSQMRHWVSSIQRCTSHSSEKKAVTQTWL